MEFDGDVVANAFRQIKVNAMNIFMSIKKIRATISPKFARYYDFEFVTGKRTLLKGISPRTSGECRVWARKMDDVLRRTSVCTIAASSCFFSLKFTLRTCFFPLLSIYFSILFISIWFRFIQLVNTIMLTCSRLFYKFICRDLNGNH